MFRQRRLGQAGAQSPPVADPTSMQGVQVAPSRKRFRMVEKLASFGDDFFIQNDQGQRVFKVDGKALRLRDTLVFRDMEGNERCKIQQRVARIRASMEIEAPGGGRLALVHKAMVTPLRDRFVVKIGDGPELEVQGNIIDHEYRISDVATISKRWFRMRDSYGVEVAPGQNDLLILAATVCIDQLSHDVRK
jgi:uncharacterized protein YxjI